MQEIPTSKFNEKEERRLKGRFFSILNRFIDDNGFGTIHKRINDTLKEFVFDTIPFKDAEHRDMFYEVYHRYRKSDNKSADNTKTAVIYLLSTNRMFHKILDSYLSNRLYSLKFEADSVFSEESYNLYQAAKKLCGMESGLYDEDLTEEGIIEDKTVGIIVTAMYLKEYGLNSRVKKKRASKPRYINNPKSQHNVYLYKGQTVKIRKRKC